MFIPILGEREQECHSLGSLGSYGCYQAHEAVSQSDTKFSIQLLSGISLISKVSQLRGLAVPTGAEFLSLENNVLRDRAGLRLHPQE